MIARRVTILLACLLALFHLARAEPSPLSATSLPPGWKAIMDAIHEHDAVVARFEEERHQPFRQRPFQLSGLLRLNRENGLSLQYDAPVGSTIVVRADKLLRQSGADVRALPETEETQLLTRIMSDLLFLDLEAISEQFSIKGERGQDTWSLVLDPRKQEAARLVDSIRVSGTGDIIRKIVFDRPANKRIEISMTEHRFPEAFTKAELETHFLVETP